MLNEEKQQLYSRIHNKTCSLMSNIEKFLEENEKLSIDEMMFIADMLKDISEVEKNIAKANHIYKNIPDIVNKKY